ncbi:hypothetical protein ACXWO0_09575, partial [Streptococcus pyogenes]
RNQVINQKPLKVRGRLIPRERDILAATGAWDSEGVAFYSAGSTPIYRLYHAGIRVHLYTADANEVRVLTTRGWDNEGIAFYAQ